MDGSPPGSPRPWDSLGKNTGVGCHFLLQCIKVKSESEVAPTLRDPMDCSLPGSAVHGIFQARVLEWGAIAFSGEVAQSCLILCNHMDCTLPGSSVHGFSRQEYWSGLPFPSVGIFPNLGSNPGFPHCRQTLYRLSHHKPIL